MAALSEDFDLVPNRSQVDPRGCDEILISVRTRFGLSGQKWTIELFDGTDVREDETIDELAPLCTTTSRHKISYWEAKFGPFFGCTSGKRGGLFRRMIANELDVCHTLDTPVRCERGEGEQQINWKGQGAQAVAFSGPSPSDSYAEAEVQLQGESSEDEGETGLQEGETDPQEGETCPQEVETEGTGSEPCTRPNNVGDADEHKQEESVEALPHWPNRLRLGATFGGCRKTSVLSPGEHSLSTLNANGDLVEFASTKYTGGMFTFIRHETVVIMETGTQERRLATVVPAFLDRTSRSSSIMLRLCFHTAVETTHDFEARGIMIAFAVQDAVKRIKIEQSQDS
ncbi:MAG: hypothetical protein MHM6MM_006346 [Cercozoa sp. M6MM]